MSPTMRCIDAPDHGGFMEVVWKMAADDKSPQCEALATEVVRVLNLWEQHKAASIKMPPLSAEFIYSVTGGSQAVKLCRTEYINMAEIEVVHPEVGKLLHVYARRAIDLYVVGQPPHEAAPIQWGQEMPPMDGCRYDHLIGECALGKFSIEWKSHKKHDAMCVYLNGDYIDSCVDLITAKAAAQNHVNKIFNQLMGKEV